MKYPQYADSVAAGVKQSVSWIDRLAWITLLFVVSTAVANMSGRSEINLLGIELPVSWGAIGIMAITIAHFYISRHIIISCADAWQNLTAKQRNALFDDIVRTGGLMTKGAKMYRGAITESKDSLALKTDFAEPPTWLHFALVLFTILSIVEIEWSLLALAQFCLAFAILLVNWKIGESWVLCFGDFGSPKTKSAYFIDGTARPRAIGHVSGFVIGDHLGFGEFLKNSISGAMIVSAILWVILLVPFFIVSGIFLLAKSLLQG